MGPFRIRVIQKFQEGSQMFGFIRKFDAAKGVGSIETTTITEDHLPLIVESGFSFGDRSARRSQ
jgi:hypothetical protein